MARTERRPVGMFRTGPDQPPTPEPPGAAVPGLPDMPNDPDLSHAEILRYSRHLCLPDMGMEGQRRLKRARVLVVGAGGLGSPAALYLAAAGVGVLGLVDDDVVDETNLQRQVLHGTNRVGRAKVESAVERLSDLNPHVELVAHPERLTAANAMDVIAGYDVVLDGSDNFPTRYLVNDASVLLGRPFVYGAILRFEGQASVFGAPDGPCYRCLFRDPPPPGLVPSCESAGVLGVVPGVIGSLQALEAIKLVVGIGETLAGRLLLFHGLRMEFREVRLRRDPGCPLCGESPTVRGLVDYEQFCGVGQDAPPPGPEIEPGELAVLREAGRPVVVDVREPLEWAICQLGDSLMIPLGELESRVAELDRNAEIVTVCHYGVRSLWAVDTLRRAGFERARSLRGGIDAWATQVDPGVPRY
jgi:molybdopterin/thiamine biosynthesis adenylyltransferase/rhodanese-related sulfurtransferase